MTEPPSLLFLSLPAEIRLLIYDYLFLPTSVYINPTTNAINPSHVSTSAALDLLLTCRQVYIEARKVAYRNHTFTIQRSFPAGFLKGLACQAPHSLITSLLIAAYRRRDPSFSFDSKEDLRYPANCAFTRIFHHICSFICRFPALRTIYYVEAMEHVQTMDRKFRSTRAQLCYRRKNAKRLGTKLGSAPRTILAQDEKDMMKWEIKVRAQNQDDNGNEKQVWKRVSVVLCLLDEDGAKNENAQISPTLR